MNEGRAVNEAGVSTAPVAQQASPLPIPPPVVPEKWLSSTQWGVITFLGSEVAFFSTLIVAYLVFYGRDSEPGGMGGPTPGDALSVALACGTTACLLASSVTVHLADRALRRGQRTPFLLLWAATIVLGALFLCGTAYEWTDLIGRQRLTLSRNLFGTTFFTLVGFHALHVTIGVLVMVIVLGLALASQQTEKNHVSAQLVSWYWHFVDGVWIVVFSVVYLMPHLG
jgi:cytochrome c oxidase subunit III